MRVELSTIDAAAIADVRARHPLAFAAPLPQRIRLWALWLGFGVFTGYCFWLFDMSPLRLFSPPRSGSAPGRWRAPTRQTCR